MTKTEKILSVFITWPFIGILSGLIFGVLFGGRGGMFFVLLGCIAGIAFGTTRTIYLYFRFNASVHIKPMSSGRLYLNRAFLVFLYLLATYTIVINVFFDTQ